MENILPSTGMYYVHAPGLRRFPAIRKSSSLLLSGSVSWANVGPAVLRRVGWRAECSQSAHVSLERRLRPASARVRSRANGRLSPESRNRWVHNEEVLLKKAQHVQKVLITPQRPAYVFPKTEKRRYAATSFTNV